MIEQRTKRWRDKFLIVKHFEKYYITNQTKKNPSQSIAIITKKEKEK